MAQLCARFGWLQLGTRVAAITKLQRGRNGTGEGTESSPQAAVWMECFTSERRLEIESLKRMSLCEGADGGVHVRHRYGRL